MSVGLMPPDLEMTMRAKGQNECGLVNSSENRTFPAALENVKNSSINGMGSQMKGFHRRRVTDRSLNEYIMRIIQVIQTEEGLRGGVIYLTFSIEA